MNLLILLKVNLKKSQFMYAEHLKGLTEIYVSRKPINIRKINFRDKFPNNFPFYKYVDEKDVYNFIKSLKICYKPFGSLRLVSNY